MRSQARSVILLLNILIVFTQCKPGLHKTASGLDYSINSISPQGMEAGSGSTVKIYYNWKWHDTVVRSNQLALPHYQALIPGLIFPYDPFEVLTQGVRQGDSLTVFLRADSLLSQKRIPSLPPGYKPGDAWVVGITVLKVFPFDPLGHDSLLLQDMAGELHRFDSLEMKRAPLRIKKYLDTSHHKALRLDNGIFVEEVNHGVGKITDASSEVSVMYTLSSLHGRVIDSNEDTAFHHTTPITISSKSMNFSPLIDSIILQFPIGEHLRLYVPAYLHMKSTPVISSTAEWASQVAQRTGEDWIIDIKIIGSKK